MKIGFIGLGRMGRNMATRLLKRGHRVVAFDRSPSVTRSFSKHSRARAAHSLEHIVSLLPSPRVFWIMIPAGAPVDHVLASLTPLLDRGDVVIDGGNSFYEDSRRRYTSLKKKRIHFLDVGTSGGLEGASSGASLTIGGDRSVFNGLKPLFRDLAAPNGFGYMGPAGAGHYVKMIHNGIEYSLLQAYGEGFEVLEKGPYSLSHADVARVWNHGGVIRSWLLELAESAFRKDPHLNALSGVVGGGETGGWASRTARKYGARMRSVEWALRERRRSKKTGRFSGKVIAAIRNEFGGHPVVKKRR
ncbi:decarboxylating 6-phosphogluconate dehydrogenase [Candidatus Micrarchaeota archaeon]|nr:decarboxylating 6-phosphogluconate dehydrogenase [Candidatus Micrarchaeota archaeon]